MATDLENAVARKSAVLAQLAAMGTTGDGARPNVDGEGINKDHDKLKASLYMELQELRKEIAELKKDAASAGGNVGFFESFEVPSFLLPLLLLLGLASGAAGQIIQNHDLLPGFVAAEHIDWTNATANFLTTGSGQCTTLGVGVAPSSSYAIYGYAASGMGVRGTADNSYGGYFTSTGSIGLFAQSSSSASNHSAMYAYRNIVGGLGSSTVSVISDNASDASALILGRHDGTGDLLNLQSSGSVERFVVEDDGTVLLPNDSQAIGFGAAGAVDSSIKYTGSSIETTAVGGWKYLQAAAGVGTYVYGYNTDSAYYKHEYIAAGGVAWTYANGSLRSGTSGYMIHSAGSYWNIVANTNVQIDGKSIFYLRDYDAGNANRFTVDFSTGDTWAEGRIEEAGTFGSIYVHDNSTATSVATGATYTLFDQWGAEPTAKRRT
jgi:hypothetical protein